MKILHITKKYPDAIGGDANVVRSLELYQGKAGHDVIILTSNIREVMQKRNIRVFGILDTAAHLDRITPKRLVSLVCFFFTSIRVISAAKPDIIHTHSPELGFLVSFPARLSGIPVIQTCHGICFNDRNFPFLKRALEAFFLKYGFFGCITTVDKTSLPDFSRLGIAYVQYIPNGVESAFFQVPGTAVSPHPILQFLYVGRLERQKGLDVLIEAATRLMKLTTSFRINIIGVGSLRDELARQISAGSLDVHMQLLGSVPRDELVRQYACSDAFVLPSRWEGMPLTLLEAWAVGLPVIVTDVGGITQICTDRENALVIPPEDPFQLCQAMQFLMEHPDIREKLGLEGNRIARSLYSWDRIGDEYLSAYQKVIQNITH